MKYCHGLALVRLASHFLRGIDGLSAKQIVFCALENVCGHKRDFSLSDMSYVRLLCPPRLRFIETPSRLMHPWINHERLPMRVAPFSPC
jgi:hypothetical protein